MHAVIGKKRSRGSHESTRAVEIASFCLRISLIFLLSCSNLKSLNIKEDLDKELEKICFSSDGSGRIEFSGQKYLFDYESLNNSIDKVWSLGLDITAYGEALVHMNYKKYPHIYISGGFYREMLQSLKREYSVLANELFLNWMSLMALKNKQENIVCDSKGKTCRFEKMKKNFFVQSNDDELQIIFEAKDKNHKAIIRVRSLDNNYFGKMELSIISKKDNFKILSMNLFSRSCGAK